MLLGGPVTAPPAYQRGLVLMYRTLERFRMFAPEFQLPTRDVALIASLADVGKYIARNEAARVVIREAMSECDRLQLGDYPTTMMLDVCLQELGIAVKRVAFEELGIPGNVMPLAKGGSS